MKLITHEIFTLKSIKSRSNHYSNDIHVDTTQSDLYFREKIRMNR